MWTLDHLAVSAGTLEEGRAAVEAALGVPLQAGGAHEAFGTHDLLLSLGRSEYLEVIAVDPEAPSPGRPRWFRLDEFTGPPRLTNWVCRVADLGAAPASVGTPMALARGDLRWRMAVPGDGRLPYGDCHPALIEWQGEHPAPRLIDRGCRLGELVVRHPRARALAAALELDDPRVRVEVADRPGLAARIDTAGGPRWLS